MRAPCLVLSGVLALSGCAGGGQATPAEGDERVIVVVANEFERPVTAYAVWPGSRRRRLGEVSSGRTRSFETPRSGSEIAIGLEILAAPPVGTTAGPTGFQGGRAPRINPDMVTSESMMIGPGEGIEWRLTSTGSLVYRRIVPE
jgi:hypothetical protein